MQANAGYGVGFAQPPSLLRWQSERLPRETELKGWVTHWSLKHIQGIQEDQAKTILDEVEDAFTAEGKRKIDWAHSKENQGSWPRKTLVNLLFVHGIDMTAMMEILKKHHANLDRQRLQR